MRTRAQWKTREARPTREISHHYQEDIDEESDKAHPLSRLSVLNDWEGRAFTAYGAEITATFFAAASNHSGIRVASNRWTQEDMSRGRDFCLIRQDVQERSWVVTSLGVVIVVVTVLCMQHFCHPISHPTPTRPTRR